MQGIKFIVVAILGVCATQSRAAEFPFSADKVELRIFVENGAVIANNLFKAINTGLDQSKPNVDKILNELAPEAKAYLRKTLDDFRTKINSEEKRIAFIFTTLTKALDNLRPIKSCSDKVSGPAKKLALATEKDIVKIVQGVETKYKKQIDNVKLGFDKALNKTRKLFDTEVDAVVKCLTPGRKDANACLDKEIQKILSGIGEVITDFFIVVQTANDTLSPIFPEVIEKLLPLLEKVLKDGRALLKTLADCVSALK